MKQYTCARCDPDEQHPDVDYCDDCQAICVHCDESHDLDADHECKEGE
jgi:hypothetical protein